MVVYSFVILVSGKYCTFIKAISIAIYIINLYYTAMILLSYVFFGKVRAMCLYSF